MNLDSWDIVAIGVPHNVCNLLLEAIGDVLAEGALALWRRRDGDLLAQAFVVGHVEEADFAVELETALERWNALAWATQAVRSAALGVRVEENSP